MSSAPTALDGRYSARSYREAGQSSMGDRQAAGAMAPCRCRPWPNLRVRSVHRVGRLLIPRAARRGRQSAATSSACLKRSTAIISIPLMLVVLGALARGTMARLKPCVAASFRRSSPLGTGRISPDSPTSPNAMVFSANGRSRSDDSTASSTGRSAAVSCTRMPPTTLTNTS